MSDTILTFITEQKRLEVAERVHKADLAVTRCLHSAEALKNTDDINLRLIRGAFIQTATTLKRNVVILNRLLKGPLVDNE